MFEQSQNTAQQGNGQASPESNAPSSAEMISALDEMLQVVLEQECLEAEVAKEFTDMAAAIRARISGGLGV